MNPSIELIDGSFTPLSSPESSPLSEFSGFVKRDGTVVAFDTGKIARAVSKASDHIQHYKHLDAKLPDPDDISRKVVEELNNPHSPFFVRESETGRLPKIEDIQDLVEIILVREGCKEVMASYKLYRKNRKNIREALKIRTKLETDQPDSTDALLLVESTTQKETLPWDKTRIIQALCNESALSSEEARDIAKSVENRAFAWNDSTISTTLVREMVNNELEVRGHLASLKDMAQFSLAKPVLESILYSKSAENSNIKNNNPEAVTQTIGEIILKQYALRSIFGETLERAHATGRLHIHDLGFPDRVYCSSHSIEYIKKYGLTGLVNLSSESFPAKTAQVLTGHINTFLASMQAYYAGALGIAYINIMYAPLLEGLKDSELHQRAQELIFNGSQNAFSRGGQTIFLDFNIHSGVPEYLKSVPAVGPGGLYYLRNGEGDKIPLKEHQYRSDDGTQLMELRLGDRIVLKEIKNEAGQTCYDQSVAAELASRGERIDSYGDYEETVGRFAMKMLEVWEEGDKNGRVFQFPKCDFHISGESFSDPRQYEITCKAAEVASRNGSVYFIFDRDQVTLSACCRLRTTIDDNYMLLHPESMRFCGFQNITINIPHAAYLAAQEGRRNRDGLMEKIYESMDMAVEAHLRKKSFVEEKMMPEGGPLWQIGKNACDGRPYVDLDASTYIIGLIGVNDAVRFLTGKEMHESNEAVEEAIAIVAAMNVKLREYTKRYGLKFTLEESPAESASRRLAKTDLVYFPEYSASVIKGSQEDDSVYYSNSIHLSADCDVSLVERIRLQGLFHGLIESGAITHAFVGEERPSAASILKLIKNTFYRTQSAQLTISPEFTYCNSCQNEMRGLKENCEKCGSADVDGVSRIVGYYSVTKNWNKSKKGELSSRSQGMYSLEGGTVRESDRNLFPFYKKTAGSTEDRLPAGSVAECSNGVCTLY